MLYGAVDIGATKITASVCSREGIVSKVYQRTLKTGPCTAVAEQVFFLIEKACNAAGIEASEIEGVGISACGPFGKQDGETILIAPNICGGLYDNSDLPNNWTEIPLESTLKKKHAAVIIGNDCVTAVVAERLFGAGNGEDNLLYVTWSTGIGAGAFVDGHLLKGKNGNALHLGHIFMSPQDSGQPQCGCGDFGHLEAYCSGRALGRKTGKPPMTLFELYRAGDEGARHIVAEAAALFARGLATVTFILDSRLIILGGSVIKNWDVLEPLVKSEYYRSFPAMTSPVEIVPSELDEFLGDIAAMSLVIPMEWIDIWRKSTPWKNPPETLVL